MVIVATCFAISSCPWRRLARVLYWCCFGTLGVSSAFLCAARGIGLVSSDIMCVTRCGGCLGTRPGWNAMSPCVSALRGGAGSSSGIFSRLCTFVGGVTCGGGGLGEDLRELPESRCLLVP